MPCQADWWGCPRKEAIPECGNSLPYTWCERPVVPSSDKPGVVCCLWSGAAITQTSHGQMVWGDTGAEKVTLCCSLPDEVRSSATEGLLCSWKRACFSELTPTINSFKRSCLWICTSVGSLIFATVVGFGAVMEVPVCTGHLGQIIKKKKILQRENKVLHILLLDDDKCFTWWGSNQFLYSYRANTFLILSVCLKEIARWKKRYQRRDTSQKMRKGKSEKENDLTKDPLDPSSISCNRITDTCYIWFLVSEGIKTFVNINHIF